MSSPRSRTSRSGRRTARPSRPSYPRCCPTEEGHRSRVAAAGSGSVVLIGPHRRIAGRGAAVARADVHGRVARFGVGAAHAPVGDLQQRATPRPQCQHGRPSDQPNLHARTIARRSAQAHHAVGQPRSCDPGCGSRAAGRRETPPRLRAPGAIVPRPHSARPTRSRR